MLMNQIDAERIKAEKRDQSKKEMRFPFGKGEMALGVKNKPDQGDVQEKTARLLPQPDQ